MTAFKDRQTDIDEISKAFEAKFGGLTSEQLNQKPNYKSWSIAEVMAHLIAVNSSYFPVLDALDAGTYQAPFHARFSFLVNWFGKLILDGVKPEQQRKTRTFPIWEPTQSQESGKILTAFLKNQEELKQRMMKASPHLEQQAVISSPANRAIVYRLEAAFDIIIAHERRHLLQAERVLAELQ